MSTDTEKGADANVEPAANVEEKEKATDVEKQEKAADVEEKEKAADVEQEKAADVEAKGNKDEPAEDMDAILDVDEMDEKGMSKMDQCKVCCAKLNYSCFHRDDDGNPFCLYMGPLQWCQVTTFLVCLWLISTLFFYICYTITLEFPVDGLYAYLIAFILFTLLFVVLIATTKNPDGDFSEGATACKPKYFRAHIEAQMTEGMTWDNFGIDWHFEHMIDLKDPNAGTQTPEERIIMAAQRLHFTNSRPVWDEHYKGDKKGKEAKEEDVGDVAVTVHHDE